MNIPKIFEYPIHNFLKERLGDQLSESSISKVVQYICSENYLQIIYSYEITTLSIILEYFTSIENYTQCVLIRDTVINYNKSTGEHLKLIM